MIYLRTGEQAPIPAGWTEIARGTGRSGIVSGVMWCESCRDEVRFVDGKLHAFTYITHFPGAAGEGGLIPAEHIEIMDGARCSARLLPFRRHKPTRPVAAAMLRVEAAL